MATPPSVATNRPARKRAFTPGDSAVTTWSAHASVSSSRDELTLAWADQVVTTLSPGVKARFLAGRFVGTDDGVVLFALPNQAHLEQCEPRRAEVEAALAAHFGRPVPLRLVVDEESGPPPVPDPTPSPPARPSPDRGAPPPARPAASSPPPRSDPPPAADTADDGSDDDIDVSTLEDAPNDERSHLDRLAQAFPGAEVVEE